MKTKMVGQAGRTNKEMPMSLHERIDRDVSPRPKQSFEFLLIYAVCFAAMLSTATVRRLAHSVDGDKTHFHRSILGEARTMASNCAAASFMGL
jgi:hypothetical protein